MVSVCIGKYSSWHSLNGDVILDLDGNTQVCDTRLFPFHPIICDCVQVRVPPVSLRDLPQLDCLI